MGYTYLPVNSYTQKLGWTVGRAAWLDSPASKVNRYWRAIEEGQQFKGLILIGLWGDRAGSNLRQGNIRNSGENFSAAGDGVGQKFVPFGWSHSAASAQKRARYAFWYYITKGKMGRPTDGDLMVLHGTTPAVRRFMFFWIMSKAPLNKIPFVSAKAVRDVEARHYYINTLASFDPMGLELQILREEAGKLMSTVFNQTNARRTMAAQTGASARTGRARQEVSPSEHITRLGPSVGLATVTASAAMQDLYRTGGGQFPAGLWQNMIIEVNRRVARLFQDAVVARMEGSPHLRPATGDLIRATKDDRNRIPQ